MTAGTEQTKSSATTDAGPSLPSTDGRVPQNSGLGTTTQPEKSKASYVERVKAVAEIAAPTSIVLGLLYYFGYVTTYSRYAYFGLDLDQIGLSQQALVLQSVAALYVPVGVLFILVLVVRSVRGGVYGLLGRSWRPRLLERGGIAAVAFGSVLFLRGLAGMAVPRISMSEWPATSPVCLGVGALLVAGGWRVREEARAGNDPGQGVGIHLDRPRAVGALLLGGIVVLSLFWATNTVAAAYGRGQAVTIADGLPSRPAVVLDTTERLYLVSTGVTETALADQPGQRFRYRYRGLRVLVAAGNRLFLIPATWRPGEGAVLMLEDDDTVRLQFAR